MRLSTALAALALCAAPSAVLAQQVRIPVSTTMERVCDGQRSMTFSLDRTGMMPLNQPTVEAYTTRVYLAPSGSGYEMVQISDSAAGRLELRADLASDGSVIRASLKGSALSTAEAEVDIAALAELFARDIYERLIVGRAFGVGDDYYAPDQRDSILGDMVAAMGLPFPVEGSIDVAYRGVRDQGGRQVHLFDGTMAMSGSGDIGGNTLGVDARSKATVSHDAETGMVTETSLTSDTEITLEGEPFRAFRMSETLTCNIQPRQA